MENKEFQRWKKLTNEILDTSRKFGQEVCQGKSFDRGFIGELLVVKQLLETYGAKLCSRVDNRLTYVGSVQKKWDIEMKLNGKSIYINAKSTRVKTKDNRPRWVRQSAKIFCDIKIDPRNHRQQVDSKKNYDSSLFYVFVDVGNWLASGHTDFFTLSDKEAKSIFGKKYRKIYHGKNGKVRKTDSTDFWVEYKDVEHFKDNHLKLIK